MQLTSLVPQCPHTVGHPKILITVIIHIKNTAPNYKPGVQRCEAAKVTREEEKIDGTQRKRNKQIKNIQFQLIKRVYGENKT